MFLNKMFGRGGKKKECQSHTLQKKIEPYDKLLDQFLEQEDETLKRVQSAIDALENGDETFLLKLECVKKGGELVCTTATAEESKNDL